MLRWDGIWGLMKRFLAGFGCGMAVTPLLLLLAALHLLTGLMNVVYWFYDDVVHGEAAYKPELVKLKARVGS